MCSGEGESQRGAKRPERRPGEKTGRKNAGVVIKGPKGTEQEQSKGKGVVKKKNTKRKDEAEEAKETGALEKQKIFQLRQPSFKKKGNK